MRLSEILVESKHKRIPRKKGQKRKSKKHSDLYTDEDPKIQAAVAMEQRAKAAGKAGPAAIYRKYINSMKKKTKAKNKK
jgi:hypothetical protein